MTIREGVAAAVRGVPRLDARTAERLFTLLAGWLMTGVFLDAWAHISRLPDSFWTPWHGVLYSGLLACGVFLFLARYAQPDAAVLPRGYDLSVVGFGVAALGGVADAIWHTVFGVEFDVEAAVSPSHLIVAAGILLVVTGPMRAAWERRQFGVPAALSALYGVSILAVILDYANPFTRAFGAMPVLSREPQLDQTVALFSFTLYGAILAGFLLLTLRRIRVAPAWLGAIVGANMIAMVLVNGPLHPEATNALLAVALLSAVLLALIAAALRPDPERASAIRAFAFLVPAASYSVYAIVVTIAFGTLWSPTFWTGLIATGGLAGLLLSSLAIDG